MLVILLTIFIEQIGRYLIELLAKLNKIKYYRINR